MIYDYIKMSRICYCILVIVEFYWQTRKEGAEKLSKCEIRNIRGRGGTKSMYNDPPINCKFDI